MKQELCGQLNELFDLDLDPEENDQHVIEKISDFIFTQDETIKSLQKQLETTGNSRKNQVLEILKENKSVSIIDIAKKLNISTKNVSSQLTYLRSDGYKIFTDHKGRKVLHQDDE